MSTFPNPDRRVAICVCTHSRAEVLERLLLSLRDIELGARDPAGIELIVIDNNPNPAVRDLCKEAAAWLPISIHYDQEPVPGITYARNRAVSVALARGADLLVFIDDDDLPRPDWCIQLLDKQAATDADLVFGSWVLDEQMPEWARKSGIFRSPAKTGEKKPGARYGLPNSASTCNVLVGREILLRASQAGPVFSHDFCNSGGEDKDFFLRAQGMGASWASAEQSIICRNHEAERYTARGLFKRGFKNGCSHVNLARGHGDSTRLPKLLARAFAKFIMCLFLLPFSIFFPGFFRHNLYRLGKVSGTLYSTISGRSIKYYSR